MPDADTIEAGTLLVASAFPDPPFDLERDGRDTGFDAELMRAVCERLKLRWKAHRYKGQDFDGIFDGLRTRACDAVASGTTITPHRERLADFSEPYYESGQGLVVNASRTPEIKSTDDLEGVTIGIQEGNTSDIVAKRLKGEGKLGEIRYYPYAGIEGALDDLEAGAIGALMKLRPVSAWLIKDRPDLALVEEVPTHERLGIAFALGNDGLRERVNGALAELRDDGTLRELKRAWLD